MMEIDLLQWTQSTINQNPTGFIPPADMQQSISQLKELPPFPATANQILQLASDPLADAKKLLKECPNPAVQQFLSRGMK